MLVGAASLGEVVVRELHALRSAGLVRSLGSGRFEIVDASALRARAGEGATSSQKVKVQASPGAPPAVTVGDGPSRILSKRLPGR